MDIHRKIEPAWPVHGFLFKKDWPMGRAELQPCPLGALEPNHFRKAIETVKKVL